MKTTNQKPQSPGKTSIFQTGQLKNRANSPNVIAPRNKINSPDKSILDESKIDNSNTSKWQQTTEIQIKNSFQADQNLREAIEQIVQSITLKIKQQETEQFIKELNSPFLSQDQSAALYLAPLEKSNSSSDFFGRVISQETKKAKAIKQFMIQQIPPLDNLNQSINTSFVLQQNSKQSNIKPRSNNGSSPQKFQAKIASQVEIDQKFVIQIQGQIKTLEQTLNIANQNFNQLQDQVKKQQIELQNQITLQTAKILQLDKIYDKIEKEQLNEKQLIQQQQQQQQQLKTNEKQEQLENTSNQEVQKSLQLVMKNLNSLAEHQQQQMNILKTALMTELKTDFILTSEFKLTNQEIQTTLNLLKEQVKQTQQQNQETLIRKQQKIETLNTEIKNLMQINKEKNEEIDQVKLQNDAIIEQVNQTKEDITKQNTQILELYESITQIQKRLTLN